MLLQQQTVLGEENGNCFATCIACFLNTPVEQVPNFCAEAEKKPRGWWDDMQDWLRVRGWAAIEFPFKDSKGYGNMQPVEGVLCIVSGKSPRGDFTHCVIGETTWNTVKYIHDPHPDQTFIEGEPTHLLFLVPVYPRKAD